MDNIDTKALWLTVMGDKNPSLTTEEIQTSVYLVLEQTKLSARVLAVEVWIESILSSQGESAWSEDKVYVTTELFPCVPQGDWLALAALKLVWINFKFNKLLMFVEGGDSFVYGTASYLVNHDSLILSFFPPLLEYSDPRYFMLCMQVLDKPLWSFNDSSN